MYLKSTIALRYRFSASTPGTQIAPTRSNLSGNLYLIRHSNYKWVTLFLNWVIIFGLYFWSDIPSSLSKLVMKYITHEEHSQSKYTQLFSWYSYPNIVLPIFSGIFIDKIGLNKCIISFALITTIGQAIFMVSGYLGNTDPNDNTPFIVAMVGRFIFGIGGESLKISWSLWIMRWFYDQKLCLILASFFGFSRSGYIVDSYAMPSIASEIGLGPALTLGLWVSVVSFIATILQSSLNTKSEK